MKRILLVLLGTVGLAVVLLVVAASTGAGRAPTAVTLATVRSGAFSVRLPETGVMQRPALAAVPALVPGNLATLAVQPGTHVVRGQVLATIENPQIASNLADAEAATRGAEARAASAAQTNDALPAQNRSAVVQAEAQVVSARAALVQARGDLVAGAQSGLGYGGTTAEEQRVSADAAVSRAQTDLREAKRIFDADRYLYSQKAVSHDTLDQSQARYQQAVVAANQVVRQRQILGGTLVRNDRVLRDRVHASEDALRQAQAALASAQATAAESHAGDVEAANADAGKARVDLDYARAQVGRLTLRAPIDGTVQAVATETGDALRPLQPGDPVAAGQTIVSVAAPGAFIVRTRVDEQDVASIVPGQRAIVSGEDFGTATLPGHVVAISPIAQRSDDPSNTSRQVLTTIALDRTLPFLRDGMTVDVDIVTLSFAHALTVPIDAVRHDGKATSVDVVRDGKIVPTAVVLGAQNGTRVVVRSGVRPGDVVVAEKTAVTAGERVVAKPTSTPAA